MGVEILENQLREGFENQQKVLERLMPVFEQLTPNNQRKAVKHIQSLVYEEYRKKCDPNKKPMSFFEWQRYDQTNFECWLKVTERKLYVFDAYLSRENKLAALNFAKFLVYQEYGYYTTGGNS